MLRKTAIGIFVGFLLVAVGAGFLITHLNKKKNDVPVARVSESGISETVQSQYFNESGTTAVTGTAAPDITEAEATSVKNESSSSAHGATTTASEKTTDLKEEPSTSFPEVTTIKSAETTVKSSSYAYSYAGFNPKPANMNPSDPNMLLVNRDYILPEGYKPGDLTNSVKSDPDSKLLRAEPAKFYNQMYLAAKADGYTLTTVSGYRSYSLQKNNFENKINKYIGEGKSKAEATQAAAQIILPPGTSEHNAGIAMDICSLYQSFDKSNEYKWLEEHAADYGFILRYPKDKVNITKIVYEPWHWRYVGVENAKAIKQSGKCLEEYLGKVG